MRILSKITKSFRVARLWSKALDLAAEGKSREGMATLEAACAVLTRDGVPAPTVPFEFNLLLAHLALEEGEFTRSLDAIRVVLKQLVTEHLAEWDKTYLRLYCEVIWDYCAQQCIEVEPLPPGSFGGTLDKALLAKVRPHLKRNFPVRV